MDNPLFDHYLKLKEQVEMEKEAEMAQTGLDEVIKQHLFIPKHIDRARHLIKLIKDNKLTAEDLVRLQEEEFIEACGDLPELDWPE
jgi:hypothetical protein